MYGFGELISVLKKNPKTIVFTEGTDPRILEASSRLLASNFLHPILIGNEDEIYKGAEESGFNIRGAEIIDPEKFDRMDEMVDLFCELRKSKGVTKEQARQTLSHANYFGTMLVKMGVADSLLGGALSKRVTDLFCKKSFSIASVLLTIWSATIMTFPLLSRTISFRTLVVCALSKLAN